MCRKGTQTFAGALGYCYTSGTRLPYEGSRSGYGRGLATVHYPVLAPVLMSYGITIRVRWPSTGTGTHKLWDYHKSTMA